jgi:hypothetical protein
MKEKGFHKFSMHTHTNLWQSLNAKENGKGFGVQVAKTWYWYENWIKEVEKYCIEHRDDLQ